MHKPTMHKPTMHKLLFTLVALLLVVPVACSDQRGDDRERVTAGAPTSETTASDTTASDAPDTEPEVPDTEPEVPDTEPEISATEPGSDASITSAADADPLVGCLSGPVFPLSALVAVAPVETAPAGVQEQLAAWLANEEGQFWPQTGWQVLYASDGEYQLVHAATNPDAVAFMTVQQRDGVWDWAGASSGGSCPLQFQLDDGVGIVEWELDPQQPKPTAEDTVVHVLATERACASAQPMGDRLNDPVVLQGETTVSITFSVQPLTGDQNCPSNPPTAVEIDLGEPLGDRQLVDGRTVGIDLGAAILAQ